MLWTTLKCAGRPLAASEPVSMMPRCLSSSLLSELWKVIFPNPIPTSFIILPFMGLVCTAHDGRRPGVAQAARPVCGFGSCSLALFGCDAGCL